MILKVKKAAALAAAITVTVLSGCGNTDDSQVKGVLSKADTVTAADSSAAETTASTTSSASVTDVTTSSKATESTTRKTTKKTAKKTTTTASETQAETQQTDTQGDPQQGGNGGNGGGQTSQVTSTTAAPVSDTTPVSSTTPYHPPANSGSYMPSYGEWCGNIVVCDRYEGSKIRGLPPFYGYLSTGAQYAQVLNQYKQMLGDSVNVYNLSCPLSSAFYIPPGMEGTFTEQHGCITNLNSYLKGVTNVDVFDVLASHLDEYIYSRTDHHWQPLGAYYAAEAFAKQAGVPFAPLSSYEKVFKTDYLGSLYTYSGNIPELANNPDTFTYYKPRNSYTTKYYDGYFQNGEAGNLFFDWASGSSCYCSFLGGDTKICEIDSDVNNGRVLVLIKDSYGNALVPFLVQSFDKIYVVDHRYTYVKMNYFLNKVGATDVLFGATISSAYADQRINMIKGMMM